MSSTLDSPAGTTASTRRRAKRPAPASPLRQALATGTAFGGASVYLAMVGILAMIHGRPIIVETLTLGQAALVAIGLGTGAMVARRQRGRSAILVVIDAMLAGGIAAALVGLLVVAMTTIDLRSIFIALSPALFDMLTFGMGLGGGITLLVVGGAGLAGLGAVVSRSPPAARHPILVGCAAVAFFGVFQELIQIMMQYGDAVAVVRDAIYTWEGLRPEGAVALFVLAAAADLCWTMLRRGRPASITSDSAPAPLRETRAKTAMAVVIVLVLLLLPVVAGSYIGQVLMLVGLYILMGMGLNLEVGLAGLLDLGFVAFFAVGAYTTALLTADSPHALAAFTVLPTLSYWEAMPIAVMVAVIVGVLFGIPVLGVRGDYLAVATLGLGEIVRVVVQSDAAAPLLAGAQGILQIPKPRIGSFELGGPVELFYLTIVCAAVAAYCAWRLENSRLGRAWMAVRDDEDVAQALGINLVQVKLLAYGLGAAFAGLAGSIFAVMLTSVYPSSFQLLVSINVLALIIVGGMGSLPGVMVGSLALVGLPELLREFGENRYLFYGAALILMMRLRPEGLWPSTTRRRELHAQSAGIDPVVDPGPAGAAVIAADAPGAAE
jgi:branched-chain amino acid transport system permease protein